MYIENVSALDKTTILDQQTILELLAVEGEFEREKSLQQIQTRAKELGCKTEFNKLYKAMVKDYNRLMAQEDNNKGMVRYTDFTCIDNQLRCGDWVANDTEGVWIYTDKGKAEACYHPIAPTRILHNVDTGLYQIELRFVVRGKIKTITVDKSVISTPTKIVQLANNSIQVNALNAPYLVKFLADVEALNPELITECTSTDRLGWIETIDEFGDSVKKFLPYDDQVVFSGKQKFNSLFNSIKQVGDKEKWYSTLRKIRAKNRTEFLLYMAASYASVLVEPIGANPFIISLWGGTGIGKTVSLMLATSVWADPNEGQYMTDAKATQTAMEIRLNVLNSLPMTLDDMAQIKNHADEDFSQLIYRWCAGKGRDRSNVDLSLNKMTSWRNCTITNGERSLVDESTQGGAVNRVIDIECIEPLFEHDGNKVSNVVRANYGFSGYDFIRLLETLNINDLDKRYAEYVSLIREETARLGEEKEDKQIQPMALMLLADELTEEHLFQDGIRLNIKDCCKYLKNKGEVSEHKRAYEYICDQIRLNQYHFASCKDDSWDFNFTQWGFFYKDDYVAVIPSQFDVLLKEGGFQSRAFKSWAKHEGLLLTNTNRTDLMIDICGRKQRYIVIKDNSEPVVEVPFN